MASSGITPPWATDNQWGHVRQATGGGMVEAGITPQAGSRSGTDVRNSRVATGGSIMSTGSAGKAKPSMLSNPYEGVLGPSINESSVTVCSHARVDIQKLIKTPIEVWKNGKETTAPTTRPPGQNCEERATNRKPSQGNKNASSIVSRSSFERLPAPGALRTTNAIWTKKTHKYADGSVVPAQDTLSLRPLRASLPASGMSSGLRTVDLENSAHRRADESGTSFVEEQPRSRSAAGMLENQISLQDALARLQKTSNPMSDLEQKQVEVMTLKGQLGRLEQIRSDKEDEIRRLFSAQEKTDRDEAQAKAADNEVEDFKRRIEERVTTTEERLPELLQQRQALEEVVRRLKLVNKGLTWRLNQGKEEQRSYHTDLRDMSSLAKDVVSSKEVALESLAVFKTSMVEEQEKRIAELARRQNTVEKMLRDTQMRGERLREEEDERRQAEAERAAEEELASRLSLKNGTNVSDELKALRERRAEERDKGELDKLESESRASGALKQVMQVCKLAQPEEAVGFLSKSKQRQQSLQEMGHVLKTRALALKGEVQGLEAERKRAQGGEGGSGGGGDSVAEGGGRLEEEEEERKTLEGLVGDIEMFAEQNRQVDAAMGQLAEGYVAWISAVVNKIVSWSDDVEFLRIALKFSRQLRKAGADPELLHECVAMSLELLRGSVLKMMEEAERHKMEWAATASSSSRKGLPSRGSGERITAITGNQTLTVSRVKGTSGTSTMQPLAPHPGFG